MKKITLFIFCTTLLTIACTSPEQDEKIKSFWMEQTANAMIKMAQTKAQMSEAESNEFVKRMTEALQNMHASKPTQPTPQPQAAQQTPAAPKLPKVFDVTMNDGALPGKAPLQERALMKQAWDEVQLDNHDTLQDIQNTFGEEVKVKAFLITTRTEAELKKEAANAADFKAYLAAQEKIIKEQQQSLQQLMQQNKARIKPLR